MDEKKVLNIIKSETENENIPDKIKPENIINLLGEQHEDERFVSADIKDANAVVSAINNKKKNKVKKFVVATAAIAATIGIVLLGMKLFDKTSDIVNDNKLSNDKQTVDKQNTNVVVNSDFKTFSSYEELKKFVKENTKDMYDDYWADLDEMPTMDMLEGDLPTNDTDSSYNDTDRNESPDYSDTNVRTEGVLEADCIKTDGEYIYTLHLADDSVYMSVAKAAGEDTEIVKEYCISDMLKEKYEDLSHFADWNMKEMLVLEDKIIILGDVFSQNENIFFNNYGEKKVYDPVSLVVVLDASDKSNINIADKFTVNGSYQECRMTNGYLYVVSKDFYSEENVEPIVDGDYMECNEVYICNCKTYNSYLVFTSYNMNEKPELVDSKAVLNNGSIEMYVSGKNIYLLSNTYEYDDKGYGVNIMEISKFGYENGVITPLNQRELKGYIDDVFCIDEYNDYLRLVVTRFEQYTEINTLYVLDSELNIKGTIDDIAPGERIYSARFTGDIGYFVTFKQVDPLFSVDLSDPTNPQIIGELKIPGFSEYMHIWDDNTMFGIGEEDGFIKLSMFDITDPTNVIEKDKTILEDMYHSSALYNHKAIFINGEKNVIGFMCEGYVVGTDQIYGYDTIKSVGSYYLYSYEDGKFVEKLEIPMESIYYGMNVRGMYIGEYIYIASTTGDIIVVSMDNYEIVKTIKK